MTGTTKNSLREGKREDHEGSRLIWPPPSSQSVLLSGISSFWPEKWGIEPLGKTELVDKGRDCLKGRNEVQLSHR